MKSIKEMEFLGKKIILRAEFNVPVEDEKILDDIRIIQALKTIKYILKKKPKLLLIVSHLGRPEGEANPVFSLSPVLTRLKELLAIEINKIDKLEDLKEIKNNSDGIFLLENIRFWPEEEAGDEEFSRKIAGGFDVYINDCFSTSHRAHASLAKFPKFTADKCAGLLFREEYEKLSQVRDNPNHPAVMVIGGAKIETKLPVIENVKKNYDFILVGGMIANEALDEKMELDRKILLPVDFAPEDKKDQRLDIGPETVDVFKEKISAAQTIIWNGPMGKFEDEEASFGTKEIMKAIAGKREALQVIGGGETLEAVKKFGSFEDFDYISMSGGAMLEFLAGKELPGIVALE